MQFKNATPSLRGIIISFNTLIYPTKQSSSLAHYKEDCFDRVLFVYTSYFSPRNDDFSFVFIVFQFKSILKKHDFKKEAVHAFFGQPQN